MYKVHYNKDWNWKKIMKVTVNAGLIVQSPLQQGLKQNFHWIFQTDIQCLLYKVHYNKDWNQYWPNAFCCWFCSYRTKSITTRIETVLKTFWARRKKIDLSYKVHYNKDWNSSGYSNRIECYRYLIVQSPLQQGLKL